MNVITFPYRAQVLDELERIPPEYLPALLKMMRVFRESVTLNPAAESFRQGWQEALNNDMQPASQLWENLDVEIWKPGKLQAIRFPEHISRYSKCASKTPISKKVNGRVTA